MMDRVNIYAYTTIKGPGVKSGTFIYLLEYITDKGPATLTKIGELEGVTEHQAHMRILQEALERLRKSCDVTAYMDSAYLQQGVESWMKTWKAAGWVNAKGKPVANREDWEKIAELLGKHLVRVEAGTAHTYKNWLETETEKREKERREKCLKGLENLEAQRK